MIVRSEDLQRVCSYILAAVDTNELSMITETLAIYTEKNFLYLAVTNREYYAKVRLDIKDEIEFNATVSADLFLKLISKITSETIEFNIEENFLIVKGNGTYKFPLIFDGDSLLELPKITIENVTSSFEINNSTLASIANYNSKELAKKTVIANPVQNLYYIDNEGCITFTSGACVNKFKLPTTVKFLVNDKLVKLFKLFKEDKVNFKFGNDTLQNGIIQTKIMLYTDTVELTAIINSDDSMTNSVPEKAIRDRAYNVYQYSVTMNKQQLISAIDRILLFASNSLTPYGRFNFSKDSVDITDERRANSEIVYYENNIENLSSYEAVFDLVDLKTVIGGIKSDYVMLNFGDHTSAVLVENNIYNIVPECVI